MIQTVRGTRDILPGDMPLWHRVEEVAREAFRRYGFREIRTPIFEKTELFARGVGEATDIVHKEMYTFTDRARQDSEGESLTLRPENTASVVRAYIQHKMFADKSPGELTKLYYVGPMFRRERPQAGRYRQFYQIGVEVMGSSDDPAIEAEVMEMLDWFLKELKITNTTLLINSVGEPASRAAYLETLREAIRPNLDKLCGDCHHRFETNALRVFDCKNESCQAVIKDLPTITDSLDEASRRHFEQFKAHLDARGIAYTINPRMVRGLDYYTRTAFEILGHDGLGSQNTIVGGGRYDGLSETIGGPPTKGFGFAFGLDRMVMSLPENEAARLRAGDAPDVFIVFLGEAARAHSLQLARQLRAAGVAVAIEFEDRKMKKAMTAASKTRARYALIIGDNEVATGKYGLKNLQTGEQESLSLDEIISKLN
ncbi:MAG TPA: histidine--tRNA ligase [Blastocatellia bacterium]|nr:histidine--tRNA ligase [Blastocatellia bacterium]HMY72450.1 histidine--tRNA ligase [Blastocatellia bacterium]HNG34292.1 histidine--tRNA ligase [Blastocatellia bacterium]